MAQLVGPNRTSSHPSALLAAIEGAHCSEANFPHPIANDRSDPAFFAERSFISTLSRSSVTSIWRVGQRRRSAKHARYHSAVKVVWAVGYCSKRLCDRGFFSATATCRRMQRCTRGQEEAKEKKLCLSVQRLSECICRRVCVFVCCLAHSCYR